MAVTPGLVGTNQTLAGNSEPALTVATATKPITTICVRCRATSPVGVVVNIPELHGSTTSVGAYVAPGEREYFRVNNSEVKTMYVSGNTAVIDWYPVATTGDQR